MGKKKVAEKEAVPEPQKPRLVKAADVVAAKTAQEDRANKAALKATTAADAALSSAVERAKHATGAKPDARDVFEALFRKDVQSAPAS